MAEKRPTAGQRRHDAAQRELTTPGGNPWRGGQTARGSGGRAAELALGVGEKWPRLLSLVVGAGLGLTISGTRDGGALALSLLTDEGPVKKYGAHPDEVDALIEALSDHLADLF